MAINEIRLAHERARASPLDEKKIYSKHDILTNKYLLAKMAAAATTTVTTTIPRHTTRTTPRYRAKDFLVPGVVADGPVATPSAFSTPAAGIDLGMHVII